MNINRYLRMGGGNVELIVASVVSLAFVILMIVIWFKAAKNMARIAADKGYKERKWFHYCFWLGLIGYLMVCAMPDKKRRRKHVEEE
ncbi:MAG: hypothetical protein IJ048_00435 [Clostridia bacterium]|nr:hypothetical protein [Clostridia bacterium]